MSICAATLQTCRRYPDLHVGAMRLRLHLSSLRSGPRSLTVPYQARRRAEADRHHRVTPASATGYASEAPVQDQVQR